MRRVAIALPAVLLLAATAAAQSNYAPGSLEPYFRIEWHVTPSAGPAVLEGFVHNTSGLFADRMRLRIDQLDGAGAVVGSTTTWVLGGVPPNNRTWFQTPVPRATNYRVEILSFDWVGRGGAGM